MHSCDVTCESNSRYGTEMVLEFRRWRRTPRGKKIIFILGAGIIIVIINVICGVNFMDRRYPVEYDAVNSLVPLAHFEDRNSESYIREQRRQKRLAIFQKIFEKQHRRSSRINNQTCQHPHLDLKHDANREAFHSMPRLNCTGKSLFYLHNRAARLNHSVLQGRELGKCLYYGIERMTDEFFTYTESLEKKKAPYDLILSHDFLRIQCNYKTTETSENNEGNNDYLNPRHLLSMKQTLSPSRGNSPPNKESSNPQLTIHSSKSIVRFSREEHDSVNGQILRKTDISNSAINESVLPTRQLQHVVLEKGKAGENELKEPMNGMEDYGQDVADERNNAREEDGDPFGGAMNNEDMFDYQQFMGAEWMDKDFDQLLVQVVPKPEVFERISKIKKPKHSSNMNVFVFSLDSMSHLSYQRKLPLTYRYLKEELGATMLNGYNIVGDATTAAIIPMMTGKTEVELPEVRKEEEDANYLDTYPMVWKKFQDAGYATLYAEDEPSIGTFNLRFNGFKDSPTDHYMRPFWQALWESSLRGQSAHYCTGSTPHHVYLLDYIKDFFVKYHNVSKFVFGFSGELTHWDNNPGEYIDQDLTNLLRFLHTKGYLDNTMLVVMGDHGARYSKVRKTVQGKLEERLPLMSVVFPPWFLHEYPQAKAMLKQNSQRLTTPFDIHETFLDILNLKRLQVPLNHEQRGMSILRDIPSNRTCKSARIDIHWCACLNQVQVSYEDKFVVRAAEKVVRFINKLTSKLRDNCTQLALKRIYSAFLVLPNEQVLKFTHSSDPDQREANFSKTIDLDKAHYQITLETSPSDAVYEVTVEVDFRNETYLYHVTPEISRINLYGDQPKCIQKEHPDLRKYCFCRNNLRMKESEKHEEKDRNKHNRPQIIQGGA